MRWRGARLAGRITERQRSFSGAPRRPSRIASRHGSLNHAQLQGASLVAARSFRARRSKTRSFRARRSKARGRGARFDRAQLQGAGLDYAHLQGASLYADFRARRSKARSFRAQI